MKVLFNILRYKFRLKEFCNINSIKKLRMKTLKLFYNLRIIIILLTNKIKKFLKDNQEVRALLTLSCY